MGKTIAILGATGSVGTQALDVARARGYRVDLISANVNEIDTERIVREFKPKYLAMGTESAAISMRTRLADTDIKIFAAESGICEAITYSDSETVVNSILGEAGLMPTLAVIDSKKRLALANKESLVIAGEIVMAKARENGVEILPVDSEHSAIYQSMKSGKRSEVKNIILTASGGPFFGRSKDELRNVTLEDTLAHPTWKMGKKITVDSATLMNKGFEVVEAAHLFGVGSDRIKVVVHRESILHSAVEYIDNSIIGEFSVPDMRMCVQYAVDYPNREPSTSEALDLVKIGALSFKAVDDCAFPLLSLASRALSVGGGMCAVMNAADEVAVEAFLNRQTEFYRISEIVHETFEECLAFASAKTLDEILAADRAARRVAERIINSKA